MEPLMRKLRYILQLLLMIPFFILYLLLLAIVAVGWGTGYSDKIVNALDAIDFEDMEHDNEH